MNKKKIFSFKSEKELRSYIREQAMKALGDPITAKMNQMDKAESNGSAKVEVKPSGKFETKKGVSSSEDAAKVKMNKMDSEQGHDKEISAATSVKAGGKKGGDETKGMRDGTFKSKKGNPSTSSSEPFDNRKNKIDMNQMDNEDKSIPKGGAKTYVEPGAAGKDGQKKANFSTKAKNEKDEKAKISNAIQLPESFSNKKELVDFIKKESKKIQNLL